MTHSNWKLLFPLQDDLTGHLLRWLPLSSRLRHIFLSPFVQWKDSLSERLRHSRRFIFDFQHRLHPIELSLVRNDPSVSIQTVRIADLVGCHPMIFGDHTIK